MRKSVFGWALGLMATAALVYWIAANTEWAEVTLPMPPKGEAAANPFYAAERFAAALGARTGWDRQLTVPPAGAVLVLSAWHWNLTERRRFALERWVESGGRLVLGGRLAGGAAEFERWSGVGHGRHKSDPSKTPAVTHCRAVRESSSGTPVGPVRQVCDVQDGSFLETTRRAIWSLRGPDGIHAVRVQVGRGTVTVINAVAFSNANFFDGDHDWLFVAATALRRQDDVHFLTEDEHPSLLALTWQRGAPVVVLALAAVGLALWRNSVRFGPLGAAPDTARRSLAEQIRGTGRFALRHGDGESLHAAAVRALTEAAIRRIPGYAQLSPIDRATALARLTGFERDAFTAAIHHIGQRTGSQLRGTLAFLETARRVILHDSRKSAHGTV